MSANKEQIKIGLQNRTTNKELQNEIVYALKKFDFHYHENETTLKTEALARILAKSIIEVFKEEYDVFDLLTMVSYAKSQIERRY
jgi:hypothetical protein